MLRWWIPCAALVGLALAASACNNECSFFERCNGDVLEICGGADQMVNRKIEPYPCEEPNSICRSFDDDNARCVHESATICDDGFTPRCDGDLLLSCPRSRYTSDAPQETRYAIATDCTELDDPSLSGYAPDATGRCLDGSDGAACGY